MVKYGVMGCGGIADRFCGVLNSEESASLVAVASRDAGRAEAFAARHGAARACTYDELVRDSNVDIVYIATVHSHHTELIKLSLDNGKNVLCEKPMVLHGPEARECFALAKKNKLLLMEGMWTRCNPCVMEAVRQIRAGLIGDVKLITANFCFTAPDDPKGRLLNPDTAGGALYDVGVYVLEFATGIMGENPVNASASIRYAHTGVDSFAAITLDFAGGATASLNCGIDVTTPHDAVIYGTKGRIALKDFWRPHDMVRYGENGVVAQSFHADFDDGFCYEIRHVAELLERGAVESDLIPAADTIACADIFDRLLG